MTTKTLKVWLVLALVFTAGFAGGVLTTRTITRRAVHTALTQPERVQRFVERDLKRKLRLTPQQETEVQQVLRDTREQLRELRTEYQPQIRSILADTKTKLATVLTERQRRRFDDYLDTYPLPSLTRETTLPNGQRTR